jgi:NAD-dependent DNA ligase
MYPSGEVRSGIRGTERGAIFICNLIFLSSATDTKKCQDAEAKGVIVVDEDWVRSRIAGGTTAGGGQPKKGKKSSPSPPPTVAPSSKSSGRLDGLVFALTGTLSVSRKEFESFLLEHGGKVAKSITKSVTHLVR